MPAEPQGPLTETVYYILLALHTPLHGYGIMQYVSELSAGRTNLGAGTLYGALTTLTEKGWIRPIEGDPSTRRKEYVITEVGRAVVNTELQRLDELLRNGRGIVERVEREGRK
ncbi:MAG: PadR family transcriptional regulator [Thermoleophilia bacterium]|nr:PadR family transcriptional regulator [Thermoleophilia bacterium]